MASETITLIVSATDQASPKLKNVNDKIKETGDKSQSSWGKLKSMGGMMEALAGQKIITGFTDIVGKLNDIGLEAQANRSIFAEMTKTIGGSDAVLEQLRTATGGIVDDVTLMGGASSMLRMGLAGNSDELATLTEMAIRLKKPTETATEAIDNFSLMLSNQSVQRLDSFGISSAAVRTRINELLDSGQALNREEAFKMAVMEQGAAALDKLGSAAYVSESSLNRVNTRIQNLVTSLGEFTARGLEAGAQLMEIGAIGAEMASEGGAQDFFTAVGNAISSEITGNPIDVVEEREKAQAFVESTNKMVSAQNAFVESGKKAVETQQAVVAYNQDALANMDMVNDFAGTLDSANNAMERQELALRRVSDAGKFQYMSMMEGVIESNQRAKQTADDLATAQDTLSAFDSGASGFQSAYDNLSTTTIGDRTIYDPQEVQDLQNDLAFVNEKLVEMQELNAQGLISDDELANAQALADKFGTMADDAEDLATAIEDLSLSELFGQTSGGRLGEISDMVSGLITDLETAAEFQNQSDLASGRETTASLALREDLAPTIAAIADELGADAAVKAMEALNNALTMGTESGLTDEQLIAYAQQQVGYQLGENGQLQPLPNMTPYAAPGASPFMTTSELVGMGMPGAGGEGVGPLSPVTTEATQMVETATQVNDIIQGWNAESLVTQMDQLVIQADEYAQLLDKAGNASYHATLIVDVKFKYNDPQGGAMIHDEMTQIINDNGGRIPD